jgi:hypothetical protein
LFGNKLLSLCLPVTSGDQIVLLIFVSWEAAEKKIETLRAGKKFNTTKSLATSARP